MGESKTPSILTRVLSLLELALGLSLALLLTYVFIRSAASMLAAPSSELAQHSEWSPLVALITLPLAILFWVAILFSVRPPQWLLRSKLRPAHLAIFTVAFFFLLVFLFIAFT